MTMITDHPPESPITAHNRPLVERVLAETRSVSRYPKISDQLECLPLQTDKLMAGAYNPTLNSKGWLVYRFHKGTASTKLAIAQLGDNGAVLTNRELVIGQLSEEDPKVWSHNGDDYLSWVESPYPFEFKSVVKFAKFNAMQIGEIKQTAIGRNDGTAFEKNWCYFSHDGQMFAVYECFPTHRLYCVDGDATTEFHSDGVQWPYGAAKGGTAPLPYEGKLLRFFHSRLDNEIFGVNWRYYIGAYLMEPQPPFKVVRVSRKPILYGSEISDIPRKDRPFHHKANVVFVSGAVETQGGWLLSIGENDSRCLLCRVTPDQLNF